MGNPDNNKEKEEGVLLKDIPPLNEIRMELAREEARHEFRKVLLNIAGILIVAAAIAALMMTRLLMLLQVNGHSMEPTLAADEIVVLYQTKEVEPGDIVGFYYGGKVLLKRVIGCAGDEIEIDQDGNVSVNGSIVEEPYISETNLGKCNQDFPCRVQEGEIFVLGDNRPVSIDSRMKEVGCVQNDQIVGKVVFRAWPPRRIGIMH